MTSEVCHEALESIIDGLSGAAFDNDRDLTRNKLFQLIKVNYRFIFDTAKKGRHYILLIPPISAINQVRIDENVIEAHILQTNIKRNDYKTLGGQSVVLQNGSFHIDAGQESTHTSVQVIDEELFYTDDSKCIKVIHINKPILGKVEHGSVPLDESNPFSKLPKNASLSDYTIFLRSFPENESVLEKLDEYVEDFNANYKMSAGTEGQIWKRVKSIWIDIVKSLVYVNPVFSTCQENSHHSNELKLAVECYLMNGIYNSIFDGLCTIHANEDVDLMDSLSAFSRVPNKEMLEVMFKYRSDFSSSVEELNSMIHLFTPIEKLRCLRKCIKQLYRTISQSQSQSSLQGHIRKTEDRSLTTDELIAILSWVIAKAAVPNFSAHLAFMQDFRFSTLANTETGYHVATFQAVVAHLTHNRPSRTSQGDKVATSAPATSASSADVQPEIEKYDDVYEVYDIGDGDFELTTINGS